MGVEEEWAAAPVWLTRIQAGGVVLSLALGAGVLATTARAPRTAFIAQPSGPDAPRWIQAPAEVRRKPYLFGGAIRKSDFRQRFELAETARAPRLHLRAWREADVWVDDEPVATGLGSAELPRDGVTIPLPDLAPGSHLIRIQVRHARGPPLLAATLKAGRHTLVTTDDWWVDAVGHGGQRALLADDTRPLDEALELPTPMAGLAARAIPLTIALVIGIAASLLLRRLPAVVWVWLPRIAVVGLASGWAALWLVTSDRLSVSVGPDAGRHVEYTALIYDQGQLPRPTQAWATYHPPLFYAASAAIVKVSGKSPYAPSARRALRLIPALAGLGVALLAGRLARRLLPGSPALEALAIACTAVLPINLVMSQFVSNEPLHGLLAGLALLAAVTAVQQPRLHRNSIIGIGVLLGLAVLTKVTTLLLVPWIACVLLAHLILVERARWSRIAGLAAVFGAAFALPCGWFFVRNHQLEGQWLIWNYALPNGNGYWQQPGFHTPEYFFRFGEVLRHPYAAGFGSFWDGLYSTFWGDGTASGLTHLNELSMVWDLPSMSACFALGVPGSMLILFGGLQLARRAGTGPDVGDRLAITLVIGAILLLGFAVLQHALEVPYYSVVKSSFAFPVLAPLGLCLAVGIQRLGGSLEPRFTGFSRLVTAIAHGWLAALGLALLLAVLG